MSNLGRIGLARLLSQGCLINGRNNGHLNTRLLLQLRPEALMTAQPRAWISKNPQSKTTITADVMESARSHKDNDTQVVEQVDPKAPITPIKQKKTWQSFGFVRTNQEEDLQMRNMVMFWTLSVAVCWTSFWMMYFPDYRLRDWAQREAYVLIAEREAQGIPHIDGNLVPPHQINLPSEEELGDFDIII